MYQTTNNSLPPGQFRFEVSQELGRGGFGIVDEIAILATNAAGMPVGSTWARKRLLPQWDTQPEARERFEREIAVLKRMSHPNVVAYRGENLRDGSERFYVMPVYRHSLRQYIASNPGGDGWMQMARIGLDLANALQHAHDHGHIHRDIKPENVLWNPGESPVIADWGLGYFVHKNSVVLAPLTRGGMGTEYYCSLEQWNTGKCDGRGDVYSLGMTLDECMTGRQRNLAYVGAGVQGDAVAPLSAGAISFNRTIQRMTDMIPDRRHASMRDVCADLRMALRLG